VQHDSHQSYTFISHTDCSFYDVNDITDRNLVIEFGLYLVDAFALSDN